jgi:Protein of unknown function (DUF2867)
MDPSFVKRAYYKDSYCVALKDEQASPVKLFHAVFAHRPAWMNIVMVSRNWLASLAGLEAPRASEIMRPRLGEHYVLAPMQIRVYSLVRTQFFGDHRVPESSV